MAARQRILNGMNPAQVDYEWPAIQQMPVFFRPLGWNAAMLQEQVHRNRAAVINAVYDQVRGGMGGGAQNLLAMAFMQDAMNVLVNDPRNMPRQIGVVPLRFPVARIDAEQENGNQPVVDGVQRQDGQYAGNFSPPRVVFGINNFWLNARPVANGLDPIPQGVVPIPPGGFPQADAFLDPPPNVVAGQIYPQVVPPMVPPPNGTNEDEFCSSVVSSLSSLSFGYSGMDGVDAAIWTSINN